jgi:hypothetical protein
MKKIITSLSFWLLSFCSLAVKGSQEAGSQSLITTRRSARCPAGRPGPWKSGGVDNGETIISHTFSVFSDPMYPPDFEHFDYVNPDAPKGGTLRLAGFGTFDSFNRYAERGDMDDFRRLHQSPSNDPFQG